MLDAGFRDPGNAYSSGASTKATNRANDTGNFSCQGIQLAVSSRCIRILSGFFFSIPLSHLISWSCSCSCNLRRNEQVSIPLGVYDDLPIAVSLLAKHGSDGFLLTFVESLHKTIKEQRTLSSAFIH